MKRFIFLLAGFVFFSTSGWANHSNLELGTTSLDAFGNRNFNHAQSFIFMENGVEFSVFQDGQFDFFISNYGPNVHAGFSNANVNFSFNTGFDYNPFVQYDSFGAVIQVENTPIFYDYFGRVNQIGNVLIHYNHFGFVHRIGNMRIFYRNNVFWRQRGFINRYNRSYVWRPWHNYYSIPPAQFCLLSHHPYRQYYAPVRHIYYRPYINNSRNFNFNRSNPNVRPQTTRSNQRYAQTPRNRAERNIRSNMERRNREISRTRNANYAISAENNVRSNATTRSNTQSDTRNRSNSRSIAEANSRIESTPAMRENRTNRVVVDNKPTRRNSSVRSTQQNTGNSRSITPNTRRTEQVINTSKRANKVQRETPRRNDKLNRQSSSRQVLLSNNRSSSNKKATSANRSSRSRR